MSLPWTVKYQPTKISEFVDNGEAIRQLENWLRLWQGKSPAKKAAFLYGPTGVGKTASVFLFAKELGYDIVEMNASDWRTKKDVERVVGMALSQSTLYGLLKRIVVLDELEGMADTEDRGGISAIVGMLKSSLSPVVFIADDAWNPKFRELRNYCILIKFQHIPIPSIVSHLRQISKEEGIEAEERTLRLIAERSGGDLRSAIIDLQALSQSRKKLKYEDANWLDVRNRQEAIFNVLKSIFTANSYAAARRAVDVSEVNYEMLFEWIYENAPYQLTDKEDLSDAMDALAKSDLYFRRIRASNNWRLLPYALDMMTAGVAVSRRRTRQGWIPFKFPQRIGMMSRIRVDRRRKLEIGVKIGEKCHVSANKALTEYLSYLKIIFASKDKSIASRIAKEIGLNEEAVDYLKQKV